MAVEPNAKKRKSDDNKHSTEILSFAGFDFCKVLKNDLRSKTAFIHSQFEGKDAVILMEKTAFDANIVQEMLTEKTELVETLKNDVYSTYKTFPDKTLNGLITFLIKVKMSFVECHVRYLYIYKYTTIKDIYAAHFFKLLNHLIFRFFSWFKRCSFSSPKFHLSTLLWPIWPAKNVYWDIAL